MTLQTQLVLRAMLAEPGSGAEIAGLVAGAMAADARPGEEIARTLPEPGGAVEGPVDARILLTKLAVTDGRRLWPGCGATLSELHESVSRASVMIA